MVVRLLGPRDEPVAIVLLNGDSINCHLNLDYSTHRLMQRSDFIRELYSVVNAKTHTGQRAECECQWSVQSHMEHPHHTPSSRLQEWKDYEPQVEEDLSKAVSSGHDGSAALMHSQTVDACIRPAAQDKHSSME